MKKLLLTKKDRAAILRVEKALFALPDNLRLLVNSDFEVEVLKIQDANSLPILSGEEPFLYDEIQKVGKIKIAPVIMGRTENPIDCPEAFSIYRKPPKKKELCVLKNRTCGECWKMDETRSESKEFFGICLEEHRKGEFSQFVNACANHFEELEE